VKLILATKMKCAAVSALISLAFVSQASAVLRPLFPAKPAPPFNGEVIITGDDSVTAIQIVRPLESIAEMQPQFYPGLRRFSMMILQCIAAEDVSRRRRANHAANPKGSKEGRRMNDAQTLVLIHTVAWPILIWALSKTWSSHYFPSEAQIDDESRPVVP
jgi:hypothetical protein